MMNEVDSCYITSHKIFGKDAYDQTISGQSVICVSCNDCASIAEFAQKNDHLLAASERTFLSHIRSERRMESFLLGRVSTKHAYRRYSAINGLRQYRYDDLHIEYSCTGKPILFDQEENSGCQVTITHSETMGISLVSDSRFLFGIDLEWKSQKKSDSVRAFLSAEEQELSDGTQVKDMELLFWSAKEALGKYLGIGLSAGPDIFKIDRTERQGRFYEVSFLNLTRHRVIGYVSTEFVLALAYYERMSLESLKQMMEAAIDYMEYRTG